MLDLKTHETDIPCGDLTLRFNKEADQSLVSWQLLPTSRLDKIVPPRALSGIEVEFLADTNIPGSCGHKAESCVQLKIRGDHGPGAFAQGRTLRGGVACDELRFVSQEVKTVREGVRRVVTEMEGETIGKRYRATFTVEHREGSPYVKAWTRCENIGETPLTLELLSSFNLDHLTPFDPGMAAEQLKLHRYRTCWSNEGRHEAVLLEDLHLERAWSGHSIQCERFGQVGSMPVRGFFPFAAVEDTKAGVLWGAQLAHLGSWQMELLRRKDKASLSGGQADREFGHWWKTLSPGESFTTPKATLSCVTGDIEDLCHALLQAQEDDCPVLPGEDDLPIIFNEWCSSWGNPNHDYLIETANALADMPVRYLVIDDGWAERPGNGAQQNGDWMINGKAFPQGLKATCDAIRERGLVPGIWFEFEVCNEGSQAFLKTEHQLKRDGETLQIGNRHFWDFRDPWVIDYLSERLIGLLRDNGLGYLKVDYNENLGIGCDEPGAQAPGSPGEGLRGHLAAVQGFFRKIREELPDLVIENCSSGGHRLEPSMMALCGMGSFSDAHEGVEIPIVAANLHHLILPRQSQIWAVLKPREDLQRIRYSLSATFLGRLCISGDIKDLNADQLAELRVAEDFYVRVAPVIRRGFTHLHRQMSKTWRTPRGWQAVIRTGEGAAAGQVLIVVHRFAESEKTLEVPLPVGDWEIVDGYNAPEGSVIDDAHLRVASAPAFSGHAWLLQAR